MRERKKGGSASWWQGNHKQITGGPRDQLWIYSFNNPILPVEAQCWQNSTTVTTVIASTMKGGMWGAVWEGKGRSKRKENVIYYTGPLYPHGVCSIPRQRRDILRCHELQHLMCKPRKSQRKKYLTVLFPECKLWGIWCIYHPKITWN